jgi:hypothetical protein
MLPIVEALLSVVSVVASVPFLIGTEVSLLINVIVVEDDKFDCEGLLLLLLLLLLLERRRL